MDGCYQGGPTRPVLGSVHFKVVKGNLDKKVENEARKYAEDRIIWDTEVCNRLQTAMEGSHSTE